MAFYTSFNTGSGGDPILTAEQVHDLLIQPMEKLSVATTVATLIVSESHSTRLPFVSADPLAVWVAEGDEITPSDPQTGEVNVIPAKIAGLTIVSREAAEDSSPEANEMVGRGIARDIARKVDQAFFGALAAPAPSGLEAVAGVNVVTTPAGETAWTDLDVFAEAIARAEDETATVGAFIASVDDALALAQLKDETGSNRPLLGTDPTMPTRRTILGVPLIVSRYVTPGKVWGIPKDRAFVVVNSDARIEISTEAYFSSDRIGVKGSMRVGFGFPHESALQEIVLATA